MTDRLALPRRYRDQLEALLSKHVPGVEVWAYGSRVNDESHDGSDLDLVLRGPALEPLDGGFYDLLEAIEKSNIPILVQAYDWAMLPESFHREIERAYVIVQRGAKKAAAGEWREVTLAEAPIAIIDGDRGENYPKQHEFLESGHCLFLNAGNVTSDGFAFSSCAFVSSDRDQRLRKGKLNRHDVVLTTRGTVGNSAYFDATIPYEHVRINSGMVILRALQPALHPRYLYILTQSQLFLSQVQTLRTGSAQSQLPIRDIERITIPLPPLSEQRAIAHVLGTLDDKIELNRRMNETLEAMARVLFKSWFVDFEPVRAKMEGRWRPGESLPGLAADLYELFPDRLVDSVLGEIPEGWGVKALGEVAKQHRSGVKPEEIDAESPYIALEHMPKRCIALTQWSNADGLASGKFKFEQGDILFGKLRPYFHKVGVAPLDGVCSTDIVVVQPKSNLWFGFVLGHTSSAEFVDYTDATSTGTRMPRTNWADMARYKVVLPTLARIHRRTRMDGVRTAEGGG